MENSHNNVLAHFFCVALIEKSGFVQRRITAGADPGFCQRAASKAKSNAAELNDSSRADPGFGQGGRPQLLRPKLANIAKQSRASQVSNLQPGSRPT